MFIIILIFFGGGRVPLFWKHPICLYVFFFGGGGGGKIAGWKMYDFFDGIYEG